MKPNTRIINYSILHVCGGDPCTKRTSQEFSSYSPRMWRWSWQHNHWHAREWVFSTYVEVILRLRLSFAELAGILHVCGGDPILSWYIFILFLYSPRMWRWSCPLQPFHNTNLVFSTYVEVIPIFSVGRSKLLCILHVCGGDPVGHDWTCFFDQYSPRMWRWS